jgi:uncharacterized membrane protein
MTPAEFEAALDDEAIVAAIRAEEARSRGEIRVHVAEEEVESSRREAELAFERLGMADTAERNGVLLYVAPRARAIVLIGDRGIDERCGEAFWTAVVDEVRDAFRAGRFTEGIVAGVRAVGAELARHFPRRPGERDADRNELPDGVSRG